MPGDALQLIKTESRKPIQHLPELMKQALEQNPAQSKLFLTGRKVESSP
jgi:hypothetical protein